MNREIRNHPEKQDRASSGMYYESPEEIERDINATRADLDDTLKALEMRLSPGRFADKTMSYWRNGPREFAENLYLEVKQDPLPFALVALGLGWMVRNERKRGVTRYRYGERHPPSALPEAASPQHLEDPKFVKVIEDTSRLD